MCSARPTALAARWSGNLQTDFKSNVTKAPSVLCGAGSALRSLLGFVRPRGQPGRVAGAGKERSKHGRWSRSAVTSRESCDDGCADCDFDRGLQRAAAMKDARRGSGDHRVGAGPGDPGIGVGKHTLTERLPLIGPSAPSSMASGMPAPASGRYAAGAGALVQRKATVATEPDGAAAADIAQRGVDGGGEPLPH